MNQFFFRMRFQLPLGLLLAVGLPSLLLWLTTGVSPLESEQQPMVLGAVLASTLGFYGFRQFGTFPGIQAGGYIITCFSITYAALIATLFFLRIPYSGWQILANFALSIFWFSTIYFVATRYRNNVFGVVPGGDTGRLHTIDHVTWQMIDTPDSPIGRVDGVVVDLRFDLADDWDRMIARTALSGTPVYHIKQIIEQLTGRVEIEHLSENTLGSLNPNQTYIKLKAMLDWVAALVFLGVTAPLLIFVALIIRLESPGPALFMQRRTGFRGKPFTVVKFRTMRHDLSPSNQDARDFAMTLSNDIRITRIGAVLRKTRIDEIPQLLNVLLGQMSWIGPRPEAIPLTEWYEKEIPFYHYRHLIKPGLTGWAQVNQGHVAGVDEVREKLHYDFYYVKNFSPWLDLLITLKTVKTVLGGFGAK